MFLFVGIIIVVWLSALTVWWLLSSFLRSSDFSKVKDRLAGGQKKKAKSGPVQSRHLLQNDMGAVKGVLPNLIKRYNVLPKLNDLIEQAGLRWSPIRTVHLCLALFIAGTSFCWFILPSHFRAVSLLVGTFAALLPIMYL